ncbi:MAG: YkgJ family cysteine cluster protein [Candidatus Hodarchaeota archaeon]
MKYFIKWFIKSSLVSALCIKKCQAKCCKGIPPPISDSEIEQLAMHLGYKDFYEEHSCQKGQYYLIKKQKKNKIECYFLNSQNYCSIYSLRPLDCQLFPFFANIEVLDTKHWKITWYYQECSLSYHILKNKKLPAIREIFLKRLKGSVEDIWQYHIGLQATNAIEGKIKIYSENLNPQGKKTN